MSRIFNRSHSRTYGQKGFRHLVQQAGFILIEIDRYKINWLWGLMTAVGRKGAAQQGDS